MSYSGSTSCSTRAVRAEGLASCFQSTSHASSMPCFMLFLPGKAWLLECNNSPGLEYTSSHFPDGDVRGTASKQKYQNTRERERSLARDLMACFACRCHRRSRRC